MLFGVIEFLLSLTCHATVNFFLRIFVDRVLESVVNFFGGYSRFRCRAKILFLHVEKLRSLRALLVTVWRGNNPVLVKFGSRSAPVQLVGCL